MMKKFKLISILSMFLLSSCNFFEREFSLKAKYLKKGDTTEYDVGETIKYGESFNFDKFKIYKVENGKSNLLSESSYTVQFSGNERLSEEIFKSSKPEVGEYTFAFEHRAHGKTRGTGMSFRVNYAYTFPSIVSLSMEDWDFFGDMKTPTINNYTPKGEVDIEYHIYSVDRQENYGKINLDSGQRVSFLPGRYKMTAIVSDDRYSQASVSCEFNVNKVDFPSDVLENYKTYYSFNFSIGEKTIEGYDIGDAKIRFKESREVFNVDRETASLEWKDKNKEVSTSEQTQHTIVLHSSYFYDFEYDVTVNVSKLAVDEPGGVYIDDLYAGHGNSIKYDGIEHTANIIDLSYFGQYRINEKLSTLKATEKGTYTIVVELVDKENLLWKKTHDNADLSFTWLIW